MNAPEGLDLVRLKIYAGIFALRFLFIPIKKKTDITASLNENHSRISCIYC